MKKLLRLLTRLFVALMPWPIRKRLLSAIYGYQLHPTARIGWPTWVYPDHLFMGAGANIGALTVAIHLDRLEMGVESSIGRSNWITGHPKGSTMHFTHRTSRDPSLLVGEHAAITKSHLIDCTDRITIGAYTTVAGYASQFITHGIDVTSNRQDCKPIEIGAHCMVGSRVIVLGGARLPDRCVLAAGAVLNTAQTEPETVYAGMPAKAIKPIPADAAYFRRAKGFVF